MRDVDSENKEDMNEDTVEPSGLSASDTKLALAGRIIAQLKNQLESLEHLLASSAESLDAESLVERRSDDEGEYLAPGFEGRSIDGVFDGERMVGEDGQKYLVPPNYSSKSKLVEGDLLRLTIDDRGRFLFKQKGPIERQRLVGSLVQDESTGEWKVAAAGARFRVLPAAVSFHKGAVGDDAVILVPQGMPSRWAAVENIVKKDVGEW